MNRNISLDVTVTSLDKLTKKSYENASLEENLLLYNDLKAVYYMTWGGNSFSGYSPLKFRRTLHSEIVTFAKYIALQLENKIDFTSFSIEDMYKHMSQRAAFYLDLGDCGDLLYTRILKRLGEIKSESTEKRKLLAYLIGICAQTNSTKVIHQKCEKIVKSRIYKLDMRAYPRYDVVDRKINGLWNT